MEIIYWVVMVLVIALVALRLLADRPPGPNQGTK